MSKMRMAARRRPLRTAQPKSDAGITENRIGRIAERLYSLPPEKIIPAHNELLSIVGIRTSSLTELIAAALSTLPAELRENLLKAMEETVEKAHAA